MPFRLLIALVAFVTGCHRDAPTQSGDCVEGDTARCSGDNDCIGRSTCNDSGEYGLCVCNNVEPQGGSDAGVSPPVSVPLGTVCSTDTDCPKGALCLSAHTTSWLGGAPTVGICVADCSSNAAICEGFADTVCVDSQRDGSTTGANNGNTALCLPSCKPNHGTLNDPACETTPGTLCEPLASDGSGFCRPVCNFDQECETGRCDRQYGVCVGAVPAREVTFGSACEPDATNCDGVCVTLSTSFSVCTTRCQFGSATDCNAQGSSKRSAACAYATSSGGLGDLGYCAELCDCDDNCSHPSFVCEALPNAAAQTSLGHLGVCTAPVDRLGVTHVGLTCSVP